MQYTDMIVEASETALVCNADKHSLVRFKVRVFSSPAGGMKPEEAILREYNNEQIQSSIRLLEDRKLGGSDLMVLGRELAGLLLPSKQEVNAPGVRDLLTASLAQIGPDRGLRLRLRLPPLLAALPWEYVYVDCAGGSDGMDGFLTLDPRVTIVRHEILSVPAPLPLVTGDIKVVVALASAAGLAELNLVKEKIDLEQIFEEKTGIMPIFIENATLDKVLAAIPDSGVFHFAGHGKFIREMGDLPGTYTGTGSLALNNQDVSAEQLGINLRGNGVRLAMLGGCETGRRDGISVWSGIAPALVKAGIPAVVANQFSIKDKCAIAFSRQFYQALTGGLSIERAVSAGRIAAYNADPHGRDWGVPVLYLRADHGHLFEGAADGGVRQQAKNSTETNIELELLAQSLNGLTRRLQAQATYTESTSPYKSLLPYDLSDSEIFFGRAHAIDTLLEHLTRSPLTVLHAESGAGKTSLLQAGVAARLIKTGHLAVYLRPYNADPVKFIKRTFLSDSCETPQLASLPLREFLRYICSVTGSYHTLYLILDQFEEFFVLLKKTEREPFIQELADCLADQSLDVRWVLALRGEFFSELAEFERLGIIPFKNAYRLNRLTIEEAHEVLTKPTAQHGLIFEPGLIETILDSLESNNEVVPTYLQLVCSALIEDLSSTKNITREKYDAQGGTKGIIRNYLKQRLAEMPVDERDWAWRLLRALITSDSQRAVRTYSDLAGELHTQGVEPKSLDTILARLVERRLLLVHEGTNAGDRTFELVHDYLVNEIEIDPKEQARKAAQELLEQEVRLCLQPKTLAPRTLIARDRLKIIEPYRNELHFTREAEMLFNESLLAVQQQEAEREAQRQSELEQAYALAKEQKKRTLFTTIGATVILVMAITAIYFGLLSSQNESRAIELLAAERKARAQQMAIQAQNMMLYGDNIIDVTRLAVDSYRLKPTLENKLALYNSLAYPLPSAIIEGYKADFSSDGKQGLAITPDRRKVQIWDTSNGNEIAILERGDQKILSANFSPDGRWVVVYDNEGVAQVWDWKNNNLLVDIAHEFGILSTAFSLDGAKIATTGIDAITQLWNLEEEPPKRLATFKNAGHIEPTNFSPDGKMFITIKNRNTAQVWSISKEIELAMLQGHTDEISSVAFSPDNRWIITASGDGTVRLWNSETWQQVFVFEHTIGVSSICFSPDGGRIGTVDGDNILRVWNIETKQQVAKFSHKGNVGTTSFNPEGTRIITVKDNIAYVWDIVTGDELSVLQGHTNDILSARFNADGTQVITVGSDDTAQLWNIKDKRLLNMFEKSGTIGDVHATLTGSRVVTIEESTATIWDIKTGQQLTELQGHTDIILAAEFNMKGNRVATASRDETARLWDTETGRQLAVLRGHIGAVMSTSFNSNGMYVMTTGEDRTVRVWDMQEAGNDQVLVLKSGAVFVHPTNIWSAKFHPDGIRIVTVCADNTVRVWDAKKKGQPLSVFQERLGVVRDISLSQNGIRAIIAHTNGTMEVWDVEANRQLALLQLPKGWAYLARLSPDGTKAIIISTEDVVSVWDVKQGEWLADLEHVGKILSIAFSPDGSQVITGSTDCIARLWEMENGRQLAKFRDILGINSVSFSPDGTRVVTINTSDTVRIWLIDPEELSHLAEKHFMRIKKIGHSTLTTK